MNLLFADTFYWIALADCTDQSHQSALTLTAALAASKIITTDEVLIEYLNCFSDGIEPTRRQIMRSVRGILGSRSFLAACDLYQARPDKGYSLTDCIPMQTMRLEGLTDVLTNDRHFEQEGFRALFRL